MNVPIAISATGLKCSVLGAGHMGEVVKGVGRKGLKALVQK